MADRLLVDLGNDGQAEVLVWPDGGLRGTRPLLRPVSILVQSQARTPDSNGATTRTTRPAFSSPPGDNEGASPVAANPRSFGNLHEGNRLPMETPRHRFRPVG